jgi:hypothetical protein
MLKLSITFIFCLFTLLSLKAQDPENKDTNNLVFEPWYEIVKINGATYIAKIISDDGREILIDTKNLGKIYIPKADIKSITKIENEKNIIYGEYRSEGPFTTRYAFTTNALPIEKGKNYTLVNLYGPEVHFAVTNHLNVGIMSTWIGSPIALALKYTIPTKNENLNFSIGSLIGSSGYLNGFKGFGGLYFANMTLGNRESNLTFAFGYANFSSGNERRIFSPGVYVTNQSYLSSYDVSSSIVKPIIHGPMFSIAGITRVGSKVSFVFDSMFGFFNSNGTYNVDTKTLEEAGWDPINGAYVSGKYQHTVTSVKTIAFFIMPGMRFQTDEKRAFQFSLAGVSVRRDTYNSSFPFPMCSWFMKF